MDTFVSIMDEEDRDPSQGPFSSCRLKCTKMLPPRCDDIPRYLDTFLFMMTDSFRKIRLT